MRVLVLLVMLVGCAQPGPELGVYIANLDGVPAEGSITVVHRGSVVLHQDFTVDAGTTTWVVEPDPAARGLHEVTLVLNGVTYESRRSFTGDTEGIKVLVHEGEVTITYLGMAGIFA